MTTFERFERQIPELMSELAPAHVPDYFDDLLRQTASHGQRPAWSYPERWLPVDITAQPLQTRPVPWRPILLVALVALAVATAVVVFVGSRPRVPPPFGEARNGLLVYRADDGSIMTVDPETGVEATVAPANARLGDPVPSRDGRRIAYAPLSGTAPSRVEVTGIDGSNRRTLAGEYRDVSSVDWSPDDSHVAFVSRQRLADAITIAATDGSGATTLPVDRGVRDLWYLPDGRLAIMAAAEPGDFCPRGFDTPNPVCALFVINADGTGLRRVVPDSPFHGLGLHPSPDGTKLVYVSWTTGAEGRLHVVDIAAGTDRQLTLDAMPAAFNINNAWFSPDGSSILFDRFETVAGHWAVVPSEGGVVVAIGPSWPGEGTNAAWAPDGRSVLAWYALPGGSSELWQLDASGRGADKRLGVDVPDLPAWQRAAP